MPELRHPASSADTDPHTEEFEYSAFPQPANPGAASQSQRLQYLMDNTPAIIYCAVPTGDFAMTFVSNNAYNVLGYRPEEMVADRNFWFDHIHPDDAPKIVSSLARLFFDGEKTYEYRFRISDGSYLWMHDTLRLMRDADGAPLEVMGSLTDITKRKQLEQEQTRLLNDLRTAHSQLLQSEKMAAIGQLAAGVAHEINNPIGFVYSNMSCMQNYVTTLFGVIEQYEQAASTSPELSHQFEEIRQQADLEFLKSDVTVLVSESRDGLVRVKDIVQALKDFSRVGENNWQVADIHRGLDSTLKIVANELKYKASIKKEYGDLPQIRCLPSQLNQVFMNLLVNAGHAIKEQGEISIRTGVDADGVWIEVGDTGCGIAPENVQRIFEPFFTTKPVGTGTGLGLSLSYGIIEKHGGKIEVTSEVGKGSKFTVRLPIVAMEDLPPAGP